MVLLQAAIVAVCVAYISGHPQCLDFGPPFKVNGGLEFCSEYQDFGCCTQKNDTLLQTKYQDIMSKLDSYTASKCRSLVQNILCLECHPYAAHLYSFEETLQKKPFPGLCDRYCQDFISLCEGTIPAISGDPRMSYDRSTFCSLTKVADEDYCYPDLNTNAKLNGELELSKASTEGCLCLEPFAKNLRNPILFLTIPGDPENRYVIAEQIGVVHIYYKDGRRLPEPFLNLTDIVLTSAYRGDERGFLGMAFHPEYATNRKVYVYFSLRSDTDQYTRISQFHVLENNPNKIDRNSQKVILQQRQPYSNHNGGEMFFGIDGYLYIFKGDGGAGGDPQDYAQNLESWLGKVLRVDINVPDGQNRGYKIPIDNPFVNYPAYPTAKPEIYAYGIRNIWRCDVDEGAPDGTNKGRIICGDVGQNKYEELDIIVKGGNYGWNTREGDECFNHDRRCGNIKDEVLPIHVYNHTVGKSVTGGKMYRGCLNPNLQGQYIFGDFVSGRLFKLQEDTSTGKWTNTRINMCDTDLCFNGLTGDYPVNIISFGEDENGEIFLLSTNYASTTRAQGEVLKIVDPRKRGDPTTCRSNNNIPTPPPGGQRPTNQPNNNENPSGACGSPEWTHSRTVKLCYWIPDFDDQSSRLRWSEAKSMCESKGGSLATPRTSQESAEIITFIRRKKAYTKKVWIGLYQDNAVSKSSLSERRRGWKWVNGQTYDMNGFTRWKPDEPGQGEKWVRIREGYWYGIDDEYGASTAVCQRSELTGGQRPTNQPNNNNRNNNNENNNNNNENNNNEKNNENQGGECGSSEWTYSRTVNKCYWISNDARGRLQWSRAKSMCESKGGSLAMPKTSQESAELKTLIRKRVGYYDNVWIGLYHHTGMSSRSATERRRGWRWVNGQTYDMNRLRRMWNDDEPGPGEKWVRIRKGLWYGIADEYDGNRAACQKERV